MKFETAAAVEQVVYSMLCAEFPRAENRARINSLANGVPPYTDSEVEENNIGCNVNHLELTKILHDARRQFSTAFLTPDPKFTIDCDYGPIHKKKEWSSILTRKINRALKASPSYRENRKSAFANVCIHGIGPSIRDDREKWCGKALGVEDVLVPSNTLLDLDNLPFTPVFRQYTAAQLMRMTRGTHVDKGWNMPLVNACLDWVDAEAKTLNAENFPEVWFPEKREERRKSDAGLYASDATPTVDCWDFYFWHDDGKASGWHRRIILDAWGQPGVAGKPSAERKIKHGKGEFLYNPGNRKYADKLSEIIHFQFADASACAPFRYHSVRSLGFLLYAVCHLQNRLRCKFNDAVFESLLQYFRVNNPADMDRLTKIDLVDKGIIPEGLAFVKQEERWKPDQPLITEAMQMNRQTMADNSASFTQDYDFDKESKDETATRTMAKVNSTAALVGSMLNAAYDYEEDDYREICRRFCIPNSKDSDVRRVRLECLKEGVPEEALNSELWDVKANRILGNGNKMQQIASARALLEVRPLHGPEAQHEILKIYDAAMTDDFALADDLNPEQPHISDSIHDSELAFGALMGGNAITPKPGLNNTEVIETILKLMIGKVKQIMASGGVGTPQEVAGLNLAAQYTDAFIQMLAQDKNEKPRVKEYGDVLGKIMNEVKGMEQRQQEAAQKQAQTNGHPDPETQQKLAGKMLIDKAKAENLRESHAQRTAQRQLQWEMEQKRKEQQHNLDVRKDLQKHSADLHKTAVETVVNVKLNRLKSLSGGEEKDE